jgi:pimeloyl-ACP methyl ester carboxylesterase
VLSKNIELSGLNVFYREVGCEDAPKLVLLHGLPASSHQYRNLLPALGAQFHVVAPDYPGFGNSDIPDWGKDAYTFDKIPEIVEGLFAKLGPVGFRIVTRRPD